MSSRSPESALRQTLVIIILAVGIISMHVSDEGMRKFIVTSVSIILALLHAIP